MTQTIERDKDADRDDGADRHRIPKTDSVPVAVGVHRKDIEGLRGIGIAMVMLWHAGVPYLPGGFVSLDVFFVLSGFLITQLLVKELRSTGRLHLRRFYGRRAKRLLPAATVVLIVVAPLAWLLLPRTRWITTAQDIIFTALYGMNWRLAGQSTDYFAQDQADSILEHFWSLSVEEQFYLVWPCLLAYVAARSVASGRRSMGVPLLITFALIGVPSFVWSAYYSVADSNPAYFVTTTRAWEFAIGGAFAMMTFTRRKLPRWSAIVVGWLGLAAIFFGAFYLNIDFPYPGYWALIPCLGALAVIVAGFTAGPAGPVLVLGTRPIQVLGRMSYSLYLCHWPVVALTAATLGRVLTPVEGVIAVAASAVPAYLLNRYVENPLRYNTTLFRNSTQMLTASAITTVVTLMAAMGLYLAAWPPPPPFVPPAVAGLAAGSDAGSGGAGKVDPTKPNAALGASVLGANPRGDQNGAPKDTSVAIVPAPESASDDFTRCTQEQDRADVLSCTYGKRGSDKIVAVIGDSHANQWVPGLVGVADARGWELREYTKAACSFADTLIATKDGEAYTTCKQWNDDLLNRLLTTEKPSMVITTGLKKRVWRGDKAVYDAAGQAELTAGLHRSFEALTKAGIPVVVLQDSPMPEKNIPDCVAANPNKLTACAGDRATMIPADHSSEMVAAAQGLRGATVVDMNDAICPTDKCAAVIGNVLVYRDASHLTGTYVRTLGRLLDARIGPLQK